MEAFGPEGESLARLESPAFSEADWTPHEIALEMPPEATELVVTLDGERRRGNDNDAYFDAVELCFDDDPPPAPPPAAEIPPYLMWVTTDAVTVLWETPEPVVGWVEYGPTPELGQRQEEPEARRIHELRLEGLEAGTEYVYRAGVGEARFPEHRFRTAPAEPTPFDFVVWADNQNGPETFRGLVELMRAEAPAFGASVGDCVQWGLEALYRSEFLAPVAPLAAEVPFLVAAGNHERLIDFGADLFERYLAQPGDEHCFGWSYGEAWFLFIDTELAVTPGSAQRACIEAALASPEAEAASLRAALFHKPPRVEYWAGFCYTGEGAVREELEPLFAERGVDIVFNGHNHLYAYTPPGPDGITWVTTGGGGGAIDGEDDFCRRWEEIVETHFVHHFLSVHVEAGVMEVRAIDEAGEELHRFRVPPE